MIFAALGLQLEGLKERRRMTFSGAVPHFHFRTSFQSSIQNFICMIYSSPNSALFLTKFSYIIYHYFLQSKIVELLYMIDVLFRPVVLEIYFHWS